jgi:hypothetical protein
MGLTPWHESATVGLVATVRTRWCSYLTFLNLVYVRNLHFPARQVDVAVHEWYR